MTNNELQIYTQLMKVMQQSSQKLLAAVTAEELMVLQDRAVKQAQIIPQEWPVRSS